MPKSPDPGSKKSKFCRFRQFSPSMCSPKSFRTKTISKNTKIVVCCPKGNFSKGRCKIGLKTQTILRKKTKSGKCPKR